MCFFFLADLLGAVERPDGRPVCRRFPLQLPRIFGNHAPVGNKNNNTNRQRCGHRGSSQTRHDYHPQFQSQHCVASFLCTCVQTRDDYNLQFQSQHRTALFFFCTRVYRLHVKPLFVYLSQSFNALFCFVSSSTSSARAYFVHPGNLKALRVVTNYSLLVRKCRYAGILWWCAFGGELHQCSRSLDHSGSYFLLHDYSASLLLDGVLKPRRHRGNPRHVSGSLYSLDQP